MEELENVLLCYLPVWWSQEFGQSVRVSYQAGL